MQGAHSNTHRLATIDDLDALLARHSLAPVVMRLGGHDYNVRTDLTVRETNAALALIQSGRVEQAFTLLVDGKAARDKTMKAYQAALKDPEVDVPSGPMAKKLAVVLEDLPNMHQMLVSARIYRASQALAQHAMTDAAIYERFGHTPPEGVEPAEEDQGESSAS